MYLHIGNNIVISCKEIVAILNIKTLKKTALGQMKTTIFGGQGDKFKSCIITDKKILYSTISSRTLLKRASAFFI